MDTIRNEAINYARRGFAVIPLWNNKKLPATKHGLKDCSKDEGEVSELFASYKSQDEPNIGIVTGSVSDIVVIDCDRHHDGADGVDVFKKWMVDNGILLCNQYIVKTPNDGLHFYYRTDIARLINNSAGKLFPGVDVRGDGGYVVAPPSVIDGKVYSCLTDMNEIPELPRQLAAKLLELKYGSRAHEILDRIDSGDDLDDVINSVDTVGAATRMSIEQATAILRNGKRANRSGLSVKQASSSSSSVGAIGGAVVGKVSAGTRNDTLFRSACAMRHQGLPFESVLASAAALNMTFEPPLYDSEVAAAVRSAFRYQGDGDNPQPSMSGDKPVSVSFIGGKSIYVDPRIAPDIMSFNGVELSVRRTKNAVWVEPTTSNIASIIENDVDLKGRISYDSFRNAIVVSGELPWDVVPYEGEHEWTNADDSGFDAFLNDRYGVSANTQRIASGLTLAANSSQSDSLKDKIAGLPKWDGVKRAETLFVDCLGVRDTPYVRAATTLWLRGAIARALKPGCKFDYMLLLQGKQGLGKSYILQKLSMSSDFYNDNLNTIDGDAALEKLRGFWIVEMAELLATKKTREVEAIKAFITSQVDSYRAPYARRVERRPRRCVFAGTTNETTFLTDRTGNRRFLPLLCGVCEKKVDMFADGFDEYVMQVWAEVLTMGIDNLVLPNDVEAARQAIFDDALVDDERVGLIQEYLENNHGVRLCARQIAVDALGLDTKTIESRRSLLFGDIRKIMDGMPGWLRLDAKKRCGEYGVQRCWEYIGEPNAVDEDVPY